MVVCIGNFDYMKDPVDTFDLLLALGAVIGDEGDV